MVCNSLAVDSNVDAEFVQEAVSRVPLVEGAVESTVGLALKFLGRDHTADEKLLRSLARIFERLEISEAVRVETWLTLDELGLLQQCDWAWSDAAVAARRGHIAEWFLWDRPDLKRRLLTRRKRP